MNVIFSFAVCLIIRWRSNNPKQVNFLTGCECTHILYVSLHIFASGIHARFLLAHKFLVSLQEKATRPISVKTVVSAVVVT